MPEPFATCLITGGTGSLGHALTRFLLDHTLYTIRIYSRDELKQAVMRQTFGEERVRYLLGDVRDQARLNTAMIGVDLVVHAAALKHIDAGEYSPEEFVKTNIQGTANVISACRTMGVAKAALISTDKSCQPINLYGATKLVAERLWTRANSYSPQGTSYVAVRYGNVIGSRGSVLETWRQALHDGKPLGLTHPDMTRFHLSLPDAVAIAWFAAQYAPRGSMLVPHLPAYGVKALAQAVVAEAGVPWEQVEWRDIGIRPGEKLHESLMSDEERETVLTYTEDGCTPKYYCIPPVAPSWKMPPVEEWGGAGPWERWPLTQAYRSDVWPWRLTADHLRVRLRELTAVTVEHSD